MVPRMDFGAQTPQTLWGSVWGKPTLRSRCDPELPPACAFRREHLQKSNFFGFIEGQKRFSFENRDCALQSEIQGYRNILLGAHSSGVWVVLEAHISALEPGCAQGSTLVITAGNFFPLWEVCPRPCTSGPCVPCPGPCVPCLGSRARVDVASLLSVLPAGRRRPLQHGSVPGAAPGSGSGSGSSGPAGRLGSSAAAERREYRGDPRGPGKGLLSGEDPWRPWES